MNRLLPAVALAALALAACKPVSEDAAPKPDDASPLSAADATSAEASNATNQANDASAASDAAPGSAPAPLQSPMLAMAYKLGLVVPADQVRPLMESHQEACERAGADQCQVLGANASAEGDERASADLSLRATPAWMRMFRTRAEADAKDLGGRIDDAATEGDDLSTSVVDTEAAQQARAAERQRLAELMRRRTNNLDQTLQVEQEITRVQGDMDQAASELAAMKGRIAMQTLTVSYQSAAMVQPQGVTAPLAQASRSFLGNFFGVLGVILVLVSYLAPFALIGAPIAWWIARRRKAKTPAAPTPAA